ncbi:diacylglycerol kinase (ATP) [Seinonella peptonophila]|uniref:Diacylglycerol kinase (ATP) n=1 Tax=Seinonella peptonophila TaxID=112248 RepID=A0A1M4Z2G6_9BACL|nr:YegS/Rv2252/BmrU family lipid kinase [Seinonella peptonophila]SHF12231.1 diacylglycerol kinase (ATP) [Seinonella peptonophila]
MRQRARLIYNPTAGREQVEKLLGKLLMCLEDAGYETSCKATVGHWDAAKEAELSAQLKFDLVVAAGGDGTIHEVINGLLTHPSPPKLGIIPAGTTNDFAHALQLPRDLLQACEVIAQGKSKKVDLGKWESRYFCNVAAAGTLTEISYEAPIKLKTMVGPLAYYAKALEKVGKLNQAFPVTLKTPEKTWEEELLLLVIANSVIIAGFDKLIPDASLTDGLFDVVLIRKGNGSLPASDLLQIAALAYRGEHLGDDRVSYFQTSSIEISTPHTIKLNLDGEWGGDLQGQFLVMPKQIEIYCP